MNVRVTELINEFLYIEWDRVWGGIHRLFNNYPLRIRDIMKDRG